MVPRYIELKHELPKTPSQKILKYQLAEAPLDRNEVFVFETVTKR
jgi:acyl-coenzyme A synthetase/AMP-(fatty) acid ligase